jgi:arylsulfatase A-like enzyme
MDAHLGRLLEALEELPSRRELVTVLTADHGEEFLDHGAFNHVYTLYEEQTSVPLLFSAPSRIQPHRVPQQVRLIDVAPTLAEMAGIDIKDEHFQGQSLVPLMTGTDLQALDAFSEATNVGGQSAIRSTGSLKLIHSLMNPEWLLFDLETDPGENRDLSVRQTAKVEQLFARLEVWRGVNDALRRELDFSGTGLDRVVLDEKTQKGLEALGYIDP